jgi:hypothetical protein
MDVIFICAGRPVREGWAEMCCLRRIAVNRRGRVDLFEDDDMRWHLTLFLSAMAALWLGRAASAADAEVEKLFFDTCLVSEAAWIGKDQKSVATNCACMSKTQVRLADPAFKDAVAKQQPYDKFPFGDYGEYQKQVLTDCPALRPLMINALCSDPAAPPDACAAVKDMVSKLK